jgi:serine phosphatase RsbU (regulator of sigma subunit)
VLYFNALAKTAGYLKDKGKALGMIKSREYCNHVETNELPYASKDIMVLYTDGITEAKDQRGEEFGSKHSRALPVRHPGKFRIV